MDYMVYAYLQLGRDKDAASTLQEARSLTGISPNNLASAYALAAIPARISLERGLWKDAILLEPRPSKFPHANALTYFARALGAARSGDVAAADKGVQELARIVDGLKIAKDNYWATEVEVQRLSAAAWTAHARDNHDEALSLMRSAADMEDKSEKHAVTPGRLVPARELLGEMLLEMNQPAEALQAFETSEKHDPNRFRGLYGAGKAAQLAGDQARARNYFERLLGLAKNSDTERPEIKKAQAFLSMK
jgi:tetratricopeptide (TPR) repeat protein